VGDAADDAGRPAGRTALAARDRDGRQAKRGQCPARAVAAGRELTAALFDGGSDKRRLFGEKADTGRVGECLSGRHAGGQDLLDHRRRLNKRLLKHSIGRISPRFQKSTISERQYNLSGTTGKPPKYDNEDAAWDGKRTNRSYPAPHI
jgi:hypothetical protein